MNKLWLIKLTGEDNLFYDSEEKVYRYRMHCPYCGKASGCQCYEDMEEAECDEANEINYSCSAKCSLMFGEWEGVDMAMGEAKIRWRASELPESDARKLFEHLKETEVLAAMQDLSIFKHKRDLTIEERCSIIEHFGEGLEEHASTHGIDMRKDIKDLTEDEARKVLGIVAEECEAPDAPMGEVCKRG